MKTSDKSTRRKRTVPASRLRRFLAEFAEDLTDGLEAVLVSSNNNTFHIHLEGATVNISISQRKKGGLR